MHTQLIGLALLGMAALAQAPPSKSQPKPPQIAAEMRARFWRAQAEAIAAAAKAKQAQEAAKTAQEEMQKECGEQFVLALDASGEPSCQARQ
ncbi:MAG: hypothetical protein ABSC93_05365 [Bryobacteraceae bacterium]|jgi:hypothetical protein